MNQIKINYFLDEYLRNSTNVCFPGSLSLSVLKIAKGYLAFLCLIIS